MGGSILIEMIHSARNGPPTLYLAIAYAASALIAVDIKATETPTMILFLRYGNMFSMEPVVPPKTSVSLAPKKLDRVGFVGKNFGGHPNHSSEGLKAVMTSQ